MRRAQLYPLIFTALAALAACQDAVRHDLTEDQANELLLHLRAAGLEPDKAREGSDADGWVVRVPARQGAAALQVLQREGLPRRARDEEGVGARGLVPLPSEERLMLTRASERRLEGSLETIDGVVEARVHLVLPERTRLGVAAAGEGRASVLIKRRADAAPLDVAQVRGLVAGGVEQLSAESVHVAIFTQQAAPVVIAPAELAAIGPVRVASADRGVAQGALALLLLIIVAESGALVFFVLRARRQRGGAAS